MDYKLLYTFVFLFSLVFTSCSHSAVKHDVRQQTNRPQTKNKVKITKLIPKEIDLNFKSVVPPILYENTGFYSNKTFGDITGIDISEIDVQHENVLINQEKREIINQKIDYPGIRKTRWQLSLVFDNDIFDNRDYYYTNGFKIELIAPFLNASPINKILIGSKTAEIKQSGLSITQNIYTPTNPDTSIILFGDRPFSAYLTLGQFRETYNFSKKLHIKSALTIGVIGPLSYGGRVQASIHEIEPVGWVNQIVDDFVIDYSILVDKGIISTPNFELNVSGRASVGTLYNKAGGGINLRLGNFMPVFRGPFSYFENKNPGGRYQFWIFAEAMVDVIGYDATLQGGMFKKNNPYVISNSEINRLVFEAELGFALYYNSIGLEYKHFYLTPEFKGAYHFGWGQLKAVLAF